MAENGMLLAPKVVVAGCPKVNSHALAASILCHVTREYTLIVCRAGAAAQGLVVVGAVIVLLE